MDLLVHRSRLRDGLDVFVTVYECEKAQGASVEGLIYADRQLGNPLALSGLYPIRTGERILYLFGNEGHTGVDGLGRVDGNGSCRREIGGDPFFKREL